MNFDRTPLAAATAVTFNWIEEIGTKIAKLKGEYDELDSASAGLPEGPANSDIERRMREIMNEQEIAEVMLSTCKPVTAKDVLIMLGAAYYRIDIISSLDVEESQKDHFERDCALLDRTVASAIRAVSKLTGVTLEELGLRDYCFAGRSTAELIAAAKNVQEEHKEAQA